jgi:hypothetical protein
MSKSLIVQPLSAKGIGKGPVPLTSIAGVIRETGRIYRLMRRGKMDHVEGRSLVWVLAQLRAMVEAEALERIENRLADMERQNPHARFDRGEIGGYATTVGSIGTTH